MFGFEIFLYVVVDGFNFIVRVDLRLKVKSGDRIKFVFDVNRIYLFDKEIEKVIVY